MKTREMYLKEVWAKSSFPPGAPGAFIRGRVQELKAGSLTLFSNGHERRFDFSSELVMAENCKVIDILIPGDIIEVTSMSRGGQSEGEVTGVKLLVPTLGESPFDQKRLSFAHALLWQKFVQAVRLYFHGENFTELRTPTLVSSPGLEPYLEYFKTSFDHGKSKTEFFLPTSPEFHLKKALALGFEKCFEFKECFRNNELSHHHQPEFLMLEWYRAYENNESLIDDLRKLMKSLQRNFHCAATPEIYEIQVVTMEKLWKEILNFDLTPQTTRLELLDLARAQQIHFDQTDSLDDLFSRLMLEKIEPSLARRNEPVVLWHFPPTQAALARLTPDGWADRFELYWKGFEIANAFHELNDAAEYRRRFEEDQKKKAALGKTPAAPIDEELMAALKWGMPPAAGIALGIERLFMALMGIDDIQDVRLFPMKPERIP